MKLTEYRIAKCNNGCIKLQPLCPCARTRMLISRLILDNHVRENTGLPNGYIYQKIFTKQRKPVIPTKPNTSGSIPISFQMPLLFRMPLLAIPTRDDVNCISKAFLLDLESFTVTDKTTKEINPFICGVCDSIPPEAQWSTFVELKEFIKLCQRCNIEK